MIFFAITLGVSSLALRVGEALPRTRTRFVPPAALGDGHRSPAAGSRSCPCSGALLALLQFFALGAAVSSRLGRKRLPPHVS